MIKELIRALQITLILAVILCGFYPLSVWIVGNVLFRDKASGGIVYRGGKAVGAQLIGQAFTRPEYFQGRPSAAGSGYDATSSSGSNFGPTNPKLADRVRADVERLKKENSSLDKIPVELLTASGSGLDPHLSPGVADVQVERVAKARGMSPGQVKQLVDRYTEGPQWGVFGEATVNVLALNLELDALEAKGSN